MPYTKEWVDPEIFLIYRNVRIYCTYDEDNFDHDPWEELYTTYNDYSEANGFYFDVTSLPAAKGKNLYPNGKFSFSLAREIIKDAIDKELFYVNYISDEYARERRNW